MMKHRWLNFRILHLAFWVASIATLVVRGSQPGFRVGWDLHVYENAMQALRMGHDPYADGIAAQRQFHATLAEHPNDAAPFTYVYSPITLPLVRLGSWMRLEVMRALYWLVFALAMAVVIWVGMRFVEAGESQVFGLVAPATLFFAGLLQNDVIFSGNVAYIAYGLVFSGAWLGWKRDRWVWFYVAVLAVSCLKAPFLTLLAIPVLSARRQWIGAGITGVLGVLVFAMQPHVWPELFRHYLEAVELQFSLNHDFSCSPAGLVADALYYRISYQVTSVVVYGVYAAVVAAVLLHLRGKFLAGGLSLKQWIPVMLMGVILLNPRVMEYDVAPITIPMALVLWRFFVRVGKTRWWSVAGVVVFAAVTNVAATLHVWGKTDPWRTVEGIVLVLVFAGGVWELMSGLGGRGFERVSEQA